MHDTEGCNSLPIAMKQRGENLAAVEIRLAIARRFPKTGEERNLVAGANLQNRNRPKPITIGSAPEQSNT
jgi:hypothetical protein